MKKKIATLGCCGIDCGLCPRYYTDGASRCPGCCGDGFELLHPPCGFVTCCAKKKELEVCAECADYPCMKFAKETGEFDSFVTHAKVLSNQADIHKHGLDAFVVQQNERIAHLTRMLKDFDDGRSKSYYCLAAALLSLDGQAKAIENAEHQITTEKIGTDDKKTCAKILKSTLNEIAEAEQVVLKLRKKN